MFKEMKQESLHFIDNVVAQKLAHARLDGSNALLLLE